MSLAKGINDVQEEEIVTIWSSEGKYIEFLFLQQAARVRVT